MLHNDLETCGTSNCYKKLHHSCHHNIDEAQFNGKFEDVFGLRYACYNCMVELMKKGLFPLSEDNTESDSDVNGGCESECVSDGDGEENSKCESVDNEKNDDNSILSSTDASEDDNNEMNSGNNDDNKKKNLMSYFILFYN